MSAIPGPQVVEVMPLGPRMPVTHVLKCDEQAFHDVSLGIKKCEVRKADRDYRINDTLLLKQTYGPADRDDYTGRELYKRITHIQRGYGLPDGLCVLSLGDA